MSEARVKEFWTADYGRGYADGLKEAKDMLTSVNEAGDLVAYPALTEEQLVRCLKGTSRSNPEFIELDRALQELRRMQCK